MKKFYLFFVVFAFISCNSTDSDYIETDAQNSLKGRWNWVSTSQGSDLKVTPTSLNKTLVLEFSGTSYKEYENGILMYNRKFYVVKQPSIYGGEKYRFVFDGSYSLASKSSLTRPWTAQSFEIIGDKLYIREEIANGFIAEYDRIK